MPYENVRISLIYECIGTLALVALGSLTSVWVDLESMDPVTQHILIAFVVSAVVGLSIVTIGKTSGAHLNPTVSLSHAIVGLLPRRLLPPYLASQLLAAVVAGFALAVLCRSIESPYYGLTKPVDATPPLVALLMEVAGTFLLCGVAFIASTKFKRAPKNQSAIVSATLFLLTVAIGPFSGASFNPSRSLGPALASMAFDYQYIYWAGPILGSIFACAVFGAFRAKEEGPRIHTKATETK